MPKTKFQEVVFSLLMAFAMVYAMELYNLALNAGGLTNQLFLQVFHDLVLLVCIVILLEKLIAGPLARKCAFQLFTPGVDKPVFVTLAVSVCTVCLMCPMMSCIATLLFQHPGNQFLAFWLQTTAKNFPMALCWQLFFAGPLVRFLFRRLFSAQLAVAVEEKE